MSFLDNSGDIILDAVLTDAGRARLARGDGSFKIVKYAFADDEIDYAKYDLNHASGSAYYDINILTTPVIEALTNNTSTMKNRLLSIPKTNLLYLPIMLVKTSTSNGEGVAYSDETNYENQYIVSVNDTTDRYLSSLDGSDVPTSFSDNLGQNGIFLSNTDTAGGGAGAENKALTIHQGLNTTALSPSFTIDPTLNETQYIVEIDNRLGYIAAPGEAGAQQAYSFLDDDNIASYSFSSADTGIVSSIGTGNTDSPISGPRGTKLRFRIAPSIELNSSTYLFTLLGTTQAATFGGAGSASFQRIDTNIRITGATTGYRLSIPITFIRKV
jgi:hypothetical protein